MNYIMSLPVPDFLALVSRAAEEQVKAEMREQWLVMLPWMTEPKPFEDFYQTALKQAKLRSSPKSAEEIIADVEAIRRARNAKGGVRHRDF